MNDVYCPYCDTLTEINHDDGYGYEEDKQYEQDCNHCKKVFVYTTSISFSYNATKADCLNGNQHEYHKVATCPEEFSKMRCGMCGDERSMTSEERESFGIPTVAEYYSRIAKV